MRAALFSELNPYLLKRLDSILGSEKGDITEGYVETLKYKDDPKKRLWSFWFSTDKALLFLEMTNREVKIIKYMKQNIVNVEAFLDLKHEDIVDLTEFKINDVIVKFNNSTSVILRRPTFNEAWNIEAFKNFVQIL